MVSRHTQFQHSLTQAGHLSGTDEADEISFIRKIQVCCLKGCDILGLCFYIRRQIPNYRISRKYL